MKYADWVMHPELVQAATGFDCQTWNTGKQDNKPFHFFFTRGTDPDWLRTFVGDPANVMYRDEPYNPQADYNDASKLVFSSATKKTSDPGVYTVLTPQQLSSLCGTNSCANMPTATPTASPK